MTTVEVLFQNIQSHENTTFVLKPGINFILADGNNVGKSTIFKVLSRLAVAPNINSSKLFSLLRYGCNEALAAFKYDGGRVVAKITKYDREAAKVFFEHVHADGEITRSVYCPSSLLDALGIVVSEQGNIINFNDANSVQLISEVSPEADTIITHVMLDSRVESIKRVMSVLGREVSSDLKRLEASAEAYSDTVNNLEYLPIVDEFFDMKSKLEVVCRLGDGMPNISTHNCNLPSSQEFSAVGNLLSMISNIPVGIFSPVGVPEDYKKYAAIFEVVKKLEPLQHITDEGMVASPDYLGYLKQGYFVASTLLSVVRGVEQVQSYQNRLGLLESELHNISHLLSSMSKRVVCPVKGEVLYTDEKCIPYSDRFALCSEEGAQD